MNTTILDPPLFQVAHLLGLNHPLSPGHLQCLRENSVGNYKRHKPAWMVPAQRLYSPAHQRLILSHIRQVNQWLIPYNRTVKISQETIENYDRKQ